MEEVINRWRIIRHSQIHRPTDQQSPLQEVGVYGIIEKGSRVSGYWIAVIGRIRQDSGDGGVSCEWRWEKRENGEDERLREWGRWEVVKSGMVPVVVGRRRSWRSKNQERKWRQREKETESSWWYLRKSIETVEKIVEGSWQPFWKPHVSHRGPSHRPLTRDSILNQQPKLDGLKEAITSKPCGQLGDNQLGGQNSKSKKEMDQRWQKTPTLL